jgi:MFS family permease
MSATGVPAQPQNTGRGGTFRTLQAHPNFRLFWIGAGLSNVGTWMQLIAQGWLVYQLTDSPFLLGLVSFAAAIPTLLFTLIGGVLADRVERRRLMIVTQTGMMLLAFLLAALTFQRTVALWSIVAIAALDGTLNAFNTPIRQSLIADLVPPPDFQNAIALNSLQFQGTRLLGPALAGAGLAVLGPACCFAINGVSFVAVIAALLLLKVPPLLPRPPESMVLAFREGMAYVRQEPTMIALLIVAAVPSFVGQPYQAMLPAIAVGTLHAGATGLGLLQSAVGGGAVVGAVFVASAAGTARRGRLQLWMLLLFGVGLVWFGLSRTMVVSVPLLVVVGLAGMAYNTLNQTSLQSLVADKMRGRVASMHTLLTLGLQPLGALLIGFLADRIGVPTTLMVGGIICAGVSLGARRSRRARLGELA